MIWAGAVCVDDCVLMMELLGGTNAVVTGAAARRRMERNRFIVVSV